MLAMPMPTMTDLNVPMTSTLDPQAEAARTPRHRARLLAREVVAPGLQRLHIAVSVPLRHTAPGQFVAVEVADEPPRFFALAQAPHEGPVVQLLVGGGSTLSDALHVLPIGQMLAVSAAQGAGWPISELATSTLHLAASGTGWAAVRPLLATLQLQDPQGASRRSLWLGYPGQAPVFETDLKNWEAAGVTIHRVAAGGPFVDQVMAAHLPDVLAEDAPWVLCGSPLMQDAVRTLLLSRGVTPSALHYNW